MEDYYDDRQAVLNPAFNNMVQSLLAAKALLDERTHASTPVA